MWRKSFKEHFGIEHIVQVRDWDIWIWSPYISDLIIISQEWKLKKRFFSEIWNARLITIQENIIDTPQKELQQLISKKDTFEKSVLVYTRGGGKVIKRYCEEPGRPNVCHDGTMMYENTYTQNLRQAKTESFRSTYYWLVTVYRTCIDDTKRLLSRVWRLMRYTRELIVSVMYLLFYR